MSEIKALDELREYAEQCCPAYEDYDARMMEIADAVEAEIAERFMELPVDAIGIPIHVGDKLIYMAPNGQEFDCTVQPLTTYEPTRYRHADPRTLEDVLQDAMQYGRVYSTDGERAEAQIAQYAAEIREMMKGVS